MDENQRIKQEIKSLSPSERIRHIWYYYKWFIIFALIVIGFASVCFVQCANNKEPDAVIMYAGPQPMSSAYYKYIDAALTDIMSEDSNGDGEKTVDLIEITLATSAPTNSQQTLQSVQQDTNRERFYIERTTGPSVIYLIDKKIYPSMKGTLCSLEDVLGYVPENAADDYGIYLSDLPCYKNTDLRYLPSDAVLCIRQQRQFSMIKGNDSEQYYNANVSFFKDIVNWTENKNSEQ